MTLIITVANPQGIYQSSDYQLTDCDTGRPVSDQAGSKQLEAYFFGVQVELAFTGIAAARVGSNWVRTIDWLLEELKVLPADSHFDHICAELASRAAIAMAPLGSRGLLTLVLTGATVGKPFRVAVISNADWAVSPPRAKPQFNIKFHIIKRPFVLLSGYRGCVLLAERHKLEALARTTNKSSEAILDTLAAINAIASRTSSGYVSEGCWVTSQIADARMRRISARYVGENKGSVPTLMPGLEILDHIKKNFNVKTGTDLRLIPIGGVIIGPGDGIPTPPPEGDPRTFVFAGSSAVGLLRSASGEKVALIEICHQECFIRMRRNEQIIVPIARLRIMHTQPNCQASARPLFPWPTLSPPLEIDGTHIDRGWEYSIGYYCEDGIHCAEFLQISRGLRNTAFLGDDDELVIVAPRASIKLTWTSVEDEPSALIEANVFWRTRPDGTRG